MPKDTPNPDPISRDISFGTFPCIVQFDICVSSDKLTTGDNFVSIIVSPAVTVNTLLGVLLEITVKIHPASGDAVGRSEADGSTADDSADGQLGTHRLAATEGQQGVEAGPRGRHSGATGRIAREIKIGGEEQRGREGEEREGLHGTAMQGEDEGGEEGGRE